MASTVVQFRIDSELKTEAQNIFENLGLDLATAIRIFLKRSIKDKGIPFSMSEKTAQNYVSLEEGRKAFYALRAEAAKNGLQDMTLEEINDEIQAYREGH